MRRRRTTPPSTTAATDDPTTKEAVAPAADPGRPAISPVLAQQTFSAVGGQLTVGVVNGALTIVAATPSDGFTAEPAEASDSRGRHGVPLAG